MKYLNYIYLKNILGFAPESGEIRFDFKKGLNVIFGTNGTGKTRLIKAIRTVLSKDIKSAWLRSEDTGNSEIELFLSDGSKSTLELIENDKGNLNIRRRFFDSIGKAIDKANILDLVSFLAIDPAKFFAEKGWHDRIKITVSALDYSINKDDWKKQIGWNDSDKTTQNLPLINFEATPITQLEDAKKYYEEKRRDAGRLVDEREKTITNLKRELPEDVGIDFDEKISQIDAEIQKANDGQRNDEDIELDALRQTRQKLSDEIAELTTRIETLTGKMNSLDEKGRTVKFEIENKYLKVRQDLASQKETWKAEQKKAQDSIHTKKLIEQNEQSLNEYKSEYECFDNYLTIIQDWKKEIIALNPIRGLEVGTKDLIVDGRPWDVTNKARQVQVFLEVAKLHINNLPEDLKVPLILCDDFSLVGQEIRDELIPKMIENDFQAIFAEADPRKDENFQLLDSFPKKEIIIDENN